MEINIEHHLLVIAFKEDDHREAEQSLSVLYKLFGPFVYNVVKKRLHSPLHEEEIAQDVTNQVFHHLFQCSTDWNFNKDDHKSQVGAFKAYLSSIARIKLYETLRTFYKKWDREELVFDDDNTFFDEDMTEEELESLDKSLSENHRIIDQVLNSFSPRDREIILTYFLYFEKGKNLPTEVLDEMESIHKTTRSNIRQIISRAKKKIKDLATAQNLKIVR